MMSVIPNNNLNVFNNGTCIEKTLIKYDCSCIYY